MQKHLLRTFVVVSALCLASAAAHAADAPEGTLVTDAATLAKLGFSADAIVYLAPGVNLSETTPAPQNYGATDPIQQEHAGNQFQGRFSTYAYNSPTGQGDVSFTGGDIFADAQLQVPSGALWESTRFWVNDTNAATDIALFLIRSCLPVAGPGAPVATILGSATSTGATGDQTIVVTATAGTVIDNNACFYWERANFGVAGLILRKSRTQYRLQVSAAPAVATFPNDVPTSSPIFRFVEAMAKSGLTGGCGPGSFCPNDPVTRGQISVFLSVALGLHFPN